MTQARSVATRNPTQCLDGFIAALLRLNDEWGITVEHAPVPAHLFGEFDPDTRTVRIRRDDSIEDQLSVLSDLWWLLTFGPHATRAARPQPHLHLVPDPRVGA